jgi:heat shock protein HtpX
MTVAVVVYLVYTGCVKVWRFYSRATVTVDDRLTGQLHARRVIPGLRSTLWQAIERDRRVNLLALTMLIAVEFLALALIARALFHPFVTFVVYALRSRYGNLTAISRLPGTLSIVASVVSVAVSAIWVSRTHRSSTPRLLCVAGALPVSTGELHQVRSALADMRIAAGMSSSPDLWVIPSPAVNAMAVGIRPKRSSIAVTTGLIDVLQPEELRAVFAHLVARIALGDTARATSRAALTASIPQIDGDAITKNPLLLFLQLVGRIAVWDNKARSELSLCRADDHALMLLKDPDALLSALSKIAAGDNFVSGGTDVAGGLFISWPDLTTTHADQVSFDTLRVERIAALRHEPRPV